MVRNDIVGQYRAVLGRLAVMFRGSATRLAVAAVVLLGLPSGSVHAQQAAAPPTVRKLSDYEEGSVEIALKKVKGEREPNPSGKRIESIEIVALDMIDDRDVLPNFLNVFHYTTRDYVIRREVLFKQGQLYDQSLVDETERNLRAIPQFTVVLLVPLKGSSPDAVHVLVVTKDVLSLRLESDPRFYNGKLYYLSLTPSEKNILGTHHTVAGLATFTTHTYSVGGSLTFPRIANSRITGYVGGGATINCDTGKAEGHFGSFSYGQPLYSTQTRWAWNTNMSWRKGVSRPPLGEWICSGGRETPHTATVGDRAITIPRRYNYNNLSGSSSVTRSFGVDHKFNVTLGAEALRSSSFVDTPGVDEASVEEAGMTRPPTQTEIAYAVDDLRLQTPPYVETRISPYLYFSAFHNRYTSLLNYNTLGLQEDLHLEHLLTLKLYPSLRAWGSTRNLFGVVPTLSYTLPIANGFVAAYASSTIEASARDQSNVYVEGALRFVSPDPGFGRLVLASYGVRRFLNYSNTPTSFGGTDRLRGYQPEAFWGPHAIVANAEYRTPPFEILSVQIAAAAFYDVGDAFGAVDAQGNFDHLHLRSGAGAGLRLGFPQLQRDVFRIDAGFPLTNSEYGELTIVAAFGQAL